MLFIKSDLLGAAALSLVHSAAHGIRYAIGIQDCLAVHIARRPANRLNQTAFGA